MVRPVTADTGPRKKHRHDLGHEDHGPIMAARTTRGIQALLGLWIGLTGLAFVYAMVVGGRGPERAQPVDPAALRGASEPSRP